MKLNQRRTVAVIVNTHQNYDRKIIRGIATYVRSIAHWSLYVEEDPLQKLPDLHTWEGDGLIVNFDDRKAAAMVNGIKKPVVGLGGGSGWYDERSGIPYFETDDRGIGRLAAEHLLERGFKNYAFCGYPPTRTNVWASNRAKAFVERLAREGYDCHVFTGRRTTARHWEQLQSDLTAWLRDVPKPLGLMGCYDVRARHVLEACRTLELHVPEEVAVIGVDNDQLMCELADPPLSSVEQGAFRLGHEAAALLDKMMEGYSPVVLRYTVEPTKVETRQSTDVLAIDDTEVSEALVLIRLEACKGLSVEDVVEQANLSRSSLDKRFKHIIGRTIAQEIQRVQMVRAKELLSGSDLPLKQVAREAGYANVQYLTSRINKCTGRTPAKYRKDTRRAT